MNDSTLRAQAFGRQAEAYFRLGKCNEAVPLHERSLESLSVRIPRRGLSLFLFLLRQIVVAFVHAVLGVRVMRHLERTNPVREAIIGRLAAFTHVLYFVNAYRAFATHLYAVNQADWIAPCRDKARVYAQHAAMAVILPCLTNRLLDYGKRGVEIAHSLGDTWAELFARSYSVIGMWSRARWADALDEIRKVDAIGERVRDPSILILAREHIAYTQYRQGQLAASVQSARRNRASCEGFGDMQGVFDSLIYCPHALAEAGEIDESRSIARYWWKGAKNAKNAMGMMFAHSQAGYVAWISGQFDESLERCREADAIARKYNLISASLSQVGPIYLLAVVASRPISSPVGSAEEKKWKNELAYAIRRASASLPWPVFRACGLWAIGRAAASLEHERVARGLYRLALRVGQMTGTELDTARAARDLGLSLLSAKRTSATGIGYLVRALYHLDRCGARPERDALLDAWFALSPESLSFSNLVCSSGTVELGNLASRRFGVGTQRSMTRGVESMAKM